MKRKSKLTDSLKINLKQFFKEVKQMNDSYENFSINNYKMRNKYDKFKSYLKNKNKKTNKQNNNKKTKEDINEINTSFSDTNSIETLSRHIEEENFMNELNFKESQESNKTINGLIFSSKSKNKNIDLNREEFEKQLENYYSKLDNFYQQFQKYTSKLI